MLTPRLQGYEKEGFGRFEHKFLIFLKNFFEKVCKLNKMLYLCTRIE